MSPTLKNARLELRLTEEQKAAIETAASISGRTVSDFTATVVTQHAHVVIQEDRQLRVDAEHFDAFIHALETPGKSVEGLRELLSRKSVFVD